MRVLPCLLLAACVAKDPDPDPDSEVDPDPATEVEPDPDTAVASTCRFGDLTARTSDGATWRGYLGDHPLVLTRAGGEWRGSAGDCTLRMRRFADEVVGRFDGVDVRATVLSDDAVRMRVGDTTVDLRHDDVTWRGHHSVGELTLRTTDGVTWRGVASPPVLVAVLSALED